MWQSSEENALKSDLLIVSRCAANLKNNTVTSGTEKYFLAKPTTVASGRTSAIEDNLFQKYGESS